MAVWATGRAVGQWGTGRWEERGRVAGLRFGARFAGKFENAESEKAGLRKRGLGKLRTLEACVQRPGRVLPGLTATDLAPGLAVHRT